VPYFCRPIALAIALSVLTVPAATSRNHSAVSIQTAAAPGANANTTILSSGTTVLVKLLINIDSGSAKVGDAVEAEVTRDVSQNHKVVVKRGSRVIGHIAALSPAPNDTSGSRVAILFNTISKKGGGTAEIPFTIQALAREAQFQQKVDLQDGRGTAATEITAASSGGTIGGPLPGGELRPEDSGVYGIPGVSLALFRTDKGSQIVIVVSANNSVRLAKGTQMVLRVSEN
jgi:hypothetical protein